MTNRLITLTFAIVVLCGTNGIAFSQKNPLRSESEPTPQATDSNGASASISPTDATPEVIAAINNRPVSSVESRQSGQAHPSASVPSTPTNQLTPDPIKDRNVVPATHLAKPKNDIAPIMSMIDSISNNVPDESGNHTQRLDVRQPAPDRATNPLNIPSMATYLPSTTTELESSNELPPTLPAADSKKFDREKLQALIKKLAINTGFVMCIGIGFILVAKQFFKAKSTSQKKKAQSPIQIKSTLKLSPKSNLHLIEASEHRLIVATDQNGIKSMVRLTESFGSTLGTLEELMDDATGDSSDTKRQPEANNAGAYSLATLALSRAQANADSAASIQRSLPELDNTPLNSTAKKTPAESASGGNDQDEIRRQMEEALRDHGLKELIMETLRKDQK